MKNLIENDLSLIIGGNLADDGAALANQGIGDIRKAPLWSGGMLVGIAELYMGSGQFFAGWGYETVSGLFSN